MGKVMRKAMNVTFVLAMILSLFTVNVQNTHASEQGYEIYPIPQSIRYQDGDFIIRPEVNVVYDASIDEATRNRLNEILYLKNKTVTTSTEKAEGKTNIFVGVYQSNDVASDYITSKYTLDASVFDQFSGHYVISNGDEICVLGKDSDAAFYGITSLKHIFNQMDGSTIRNFIIEDYADTNIRGFIEGYYGNPWTFEDRMSLMELGGDFKMTAYIFAPKDDPYHTSKWREEYPAEELAKIKQAVDLGNAVKCRFVWTAHPFMGGVFNTNDVQGEINALLNKFEQLYSVGVRQFGVLGDDVGSLNREAIIQVMNAVSKWAKEKGDVYDTVFCPAGYNDSWQGDYSELNDYDLGFPEDVQIFWTGQAVCQPVEQVTLTNFRTKGLAAGQSARRSPLFWLNWPVNDINASRLMLGKGSLLHTDINLNDLAGIVTNPMQEAEASKIAIFAVADYAWNVQAFNANQSWNDGFKYIEPNASEALHTLAKHMSNPQPNGHGLVLAESEELQPLINEVKRKLANGEDLGESGTRLINEMDTIINACDELYALSKNENLKKEMQPFVDSLRELSTAIKLFAESEAAFAKDDKTTAYEKHTRASAIYLSSKEHLRECVGKYYKVSPGSTHLIPLADAFIDALKNPINDYVNSGSGEVPLVMTASSGFSNFYSGKIEDILDGDSGTYAWYGGGEAAGQYYQVNFSKPTTIYGVHIENGAGANSPNDTFGYAKLKYTTDGTTWKDVSSKEYGPYANKVDVEVKLEDIVAVRYECSRTAGSNWPSMREFQVDLTQTIATDFTMEPIHTTDGWSMYGGTTANAMVDGNKSTYAQFNVRQGDSNYGDTMIEGDYVGVKLSKPIVLGKIEILQAESGDDYIKEGMLQYSNDGKNWIDIQATNTRDINIDLADLGITAQYVRLKQTKNQHNWLTIREFSVDMAFVTPNPTMTVIKSDTWGVYTGSDADVIDNNDSTAVHYAVRNDNALGDDKDWMFVGDYIGVKLDKAITLGKVHILQGPSDNSDDYIKNATLQYSLDGVNWIDIDTFVNQRAIDVDLSSQNIVAQYVRLRQNEKQKNWAGMRSFQVESRSFFNGNVYTNVEALEEINANYFETTNFMEQHKQVTLNSGEFIGLKLDRIHELSKITADFSDATGLQIQVGKNEYEFETVTAGTLTDTDARYIRIINQTSSAKTFTINQFVVDTHEFQDKSLYATNIGKIDDALNVFDGDWTSQAIYNSSQIAGRYFVYDLGQTVHVDTFKAVCRDSEHDFPRHGKFSVSTDGVTWTDIMTLGKQDGDNPNEAANTDEIGYVLPNHEISYNTKEATGINKDARYLKFEITRTKSGDDKWVRFQELEINGGAYIPTVNNPTFGSDCNDTQDGFYEYMMDSDVSTMYIPDRDKGYVTYSLDENNQVNSIKVIQNSAVISNAVVSARVISKTRSAQWIELGKLSQTINEFIMPENTILLDVKIKWENVTPNISELSVYSSKMESLHKDTLYDLITNLEDTSSWTLNSKQTYDAVIASGKEVYAGQYVSQTTVDETVKSIQKAIDDKAIKGDSATLQAQIDNAKTDAALYTNSTWKAYDKALSTAANALKDKDNLTAEMIEGYIKAIHDADAALKYNPSASEEATLSVQDTDLFIAGVKKNQYTVNSLHALTEANQAIKDLLEANKTAQVHPDQFKKVMETLADKKSGLVQTLTLPTLIEELDKMDENDYSLDSYRAYKEVVENSKELLVSGTDATIAQAIKDITEAKGKLKPASSYDHLVHLLQIAKKADPTLYTEESYAELKAEIEKLDSLDLTLLTEDEIKDAIDALNDKSNALVSIKDLKEIIAGAQSYPEEAYTTTSYAALTKAINDAKALYRDGTQAQVIAAMKNVNNAILALNTKVDKEAAKEYIEAIEEIDDTIYTKESVDAYAKAYAVLKEMLTDLDDVSALDFQKAKENFENARNALQKISENNGQDDKSEGMIIPSTNTGDPSNITVFLVLFLSTGLYLSMKKKELFGSSSNYRI